MSEVLFLSHRIPYPPNKGDKIRSWHLLKALTARHQVHLASFVDDPDDLQHIATLRRHCGEVRIEALRPLPARLRGLAGLARGTSVTEGSYRSSAMRDWVRSLLERRPIECVFVFSSAVAQYAELPGVSYPRRVIDLCDVDSDKWRQYSRSGSRWVRWVYALEARRLAAQETRWVGEFDATIVISAAEKKLLDGQCGRPERISIVRNGVDTDYFDPTQAFSSPFQPDAQPIVFTGAMDYLANVDGVEWFAQSVLPRIREACPRALFAIVGSNPAPRVRALTRLPGVMVTGSVADVRPYLVHAACAVVPLRIARGLQNKLLEAMAMGRPTVTTRAGARGLTEGDSIPGVALADDPDSFAGAVIARLERDARASHNEPARRFAVDHYGWSANLRRFLELVDGCGLAASPAMRQLQQGALS
ncbi:MAG TPA: TIGR03087 family PEP-CTERM/XrtA system glycosyltransferase [Steroidobacteraceae bacterium]|jgi:sugar transferase (PEP-CTERM/EpsH1 system associated)